MNANAFDMLLASLRLEEGLRLSPYRCTAKRLTIGYGHNMEANPLTGDIADTLKRTGLITKDQAERLLAQDAGKALLCARRIIPTFDALTPARQAVLAEMAYQMGPGGLASFRGMRKAIAERDWTAAARRMLLSKWARKDTPGRAKRLSRRMAQG